MHTLRTAFLSLTMVTFLLSAHGCKPAESGAGEPEPVDATAATSTEQTEHAAPNSDQDQAPDAEAASTDAVSDAEPDDSNVITRSLPRFHDAFDSVPAFQQWMETFHVHKEFHRVPEAIGYYCSSPLFENYESRIPMSAYFGAILKQSDETVDLCYNELSLEGRVAELTVLGYAAWFANTEHSRDMIFMARQIWTHDSLVRMFNLIHTSKIVDTMDRKVDEDPRVVLMLWLEYFATGDEDRARKAIQYAYMHNAPEGTWQRAAGQASHPVFTKLLPFDAFVRGIAEEVVVTTESPAVRTYLTNAIEAAGPLRPRPEITPGT